MGIRSDPARRSILKEAGIKARFPDLRHTAVTTMAEKGLPDLSIMAQVGHVSPEMMKTYSHIRRQALNQRPRHSSLTSRPSNPLWSSLTDSADNQYT